MGGLGEGVGMRVWERVWVVRVWAGLDRVWVWRGCGCGEGLGG